MPVTFTVASHDANPVQKFRRMEAAQAVLDATWGSNQGRQAKSGRVLQSTFASPEDLTNIVPQKNGFVGPLLMAYNQHHHITLRPDDVWIAIVGQFSFYVNAHAEELRSHFVAHEGKKTLDVSMGSLDAELLALEMANLLDRNVVDPELKDWILPDFSTTTKNDTVTSAVLMMATMKTYFDFRCHLLCGIPSVTLEGEKEDWENLLARIDKLTSFGAEPAQWTEYLRPILRRFVAAFDGERDMDFWGRVCHYSSGGSGPTYLSGWVTAFCVWTPEGKWLGGRPGRAGKPVLDNLVYPSIDTDDIPPGFAEVDVLLDDNGVERECMMVAGHVAFETIGEKGDGLRPQPGWFFFEKD